MATTKEIFFKGLCYTVTAIQRAKEELQECRETIGYLTNAYDKAQLRYKHRVESRISDLTNYIKTLEETFKRDIEYFGYTEQDLNGKFKPYVMSDEEIEKDRLKDEKERAKNYNEQDLINLVKQFEQSRNK